MRRALALSLVFASSVAVADEPAEDAKTAIADRGIVLKAGKRNFFVVVPPAESPPGIWPGSVLYKARVFYGDAKTLIELGGGAMQSSEGEYRDLGQDPRFLDVSTLWHKSGTYELRCSTTLGPAQNTQHTVTLTNGDRNAVAKSAIVTPRTPRLGYLLVRLQSSTVYIYIDRQGEGDMRVFMGKRGGMKQVTIKEVADDSKSLVIVTAKGTLTLMKAASKAEKATATFGPAKKPAAVDVLPIDANRKLIYRDLGIYTRERTGQPCDEL